MRKNTDSVIRTYQLWTYDVWGNAKDGFEVNDRYKHGVVSIKCHAKKFNVGTPQEFTSFIQLTAS